MDCMRNNFIKGALLDRRYRTVCPINHGSFGMVFKAQDVVSGELVALKCLTKASAAAAGAPAFAVDDRSEELAIHRLIGNHSNIVNLLHHFETEHHIYLVLEYCPNGDLYEAIRFGRGPGQIEHVRECMLQLVDAVQHMHSKGVYHRDIKPENIFLAHSGAMKLGDFGLATMDVVSFESAVGSDRYMAPEQMDPSSSGYSPAMADIWAIGICMLNMLFSRNPFATPTLSDPLFSDFVTDRQTLFDVFPNMSQDTFEVLVHCLAIDPTKRSLSAARNAIKRAVAFTTDDESLDDFCADSAPVITASANREPLRTPSMSTPQLDPTGAFPWAKALAMTPPVRQLSVIADDELSDDLFLEMDESSGQDWFPAPGQPDNASLVSFVDSGLGMSFKSHNLSADPINIGRSKPVPICGSLPISMARPIPSMASVFGNNREAVSKSWSDLWDEDEEMAAGDRVENQENGDFFRGRSFAPKTTWSEDSNGSDTPRVGLSEVKNPEMINNSCNRTPDASAKVDERVSEHTGFLFEEHNEMDTSKSLPGSPSIGKYSPPKPNSVDKWTALGERRRAYPTTTKTDAPAVQQALKKRSTPAAGWRKGLNWGLWSQGHQNTNNQQNIGNDNKPDGPASPDLKEWNMSKDWRKHDNVPPNQRVDSHRVGPRQFEWVWRI